MDVVQWIDEKKDFFTGLSDRIWSLAETAFQEIQSARKIIEVLEKDGFKIKRGVAEIPTAFIASYGSGNPVIALLGEYDFVNILEAPNNTVIARVAASLGSRGTLTPLTLSAITVEDLVKEIQMAKALE